MPQHSHGDRQPSSDTRVDHDHNVCEQDHPGHSGHTHGATRGSDVVDVSDSRLLWTVILNQLLTVGQVAAGVISGSVALLSDAAHNFNDANALLIAYIARRISRKHANERYTFGYRRAEMIGALINLTLLAAIGLYLIYEGFKRFFEPEEISGWLMGAAALLALVVDVATAVLLWAMSRGSLNVRAAFVHNVVDALGSIAVLVGAAAIIWRDWTWVDPTITFLIAGYVLWQVFKMLPQAIRMLMEGAPTELNLDALVESVKQVAGVVDMHHLHVWELDELVEDRKSVAYVDGVHLGDRRILEKQHRSLEAHIVIARDNCGQMESIKRYIKECLADKWDIAHSTLEFETPELSMSGKHDAATVADH